MKMNDFWFQNLIVFQNQTFLSNLLEKDMILTQFCMANPNLPSFFQLWSLFSKLFKKIIICFKILPKVFQPIKIEYDRNKYDFPKSRYISNMFGKKWIDSDKLFFGVSKLIIFVINDYNSTKPLKIDFP
jgi:hypothetical protein